MNDTALLITNALPSDNLLWSTGDITDSITVTNAGTYTLTVTRGACSATDSIVVIQSPTVSVDLGLDSVFACGQYYLDAGAGFTDYNWSNGNTQAAFTTTFNGTYYVTVTNNFGCTAEDSILVEIGLAPFINLGIDSSDCDSFQIISGGGFDTYLWSDNSTTEDLWVTTNRRLWLNGYGCSRMYC